MDHARRMQEQRIFYPISRYYKQKFGEKVFKIPVALAGRCPNLKDGSGLKTCVFCDEWGSFAYPENQQLSLKDQIETHRKKVALRYKTKKFFVYFQAYTTTFTQIQKVRESIEEALSHDDVVGIVLGTRPDCLSPALLDLFNETAEKTFMAVELGIQSFDNKQLIWMRRGHSSEQSQTALERIKNHCPNVDLGVHLIFGWPNESELDIVESAKICNRLKIDNVKLHNLHVLKNTPLEEYFNEGQFKPIELEAYAQRVAVFLSHLSPEIAVHRLVATASRWEELVAPAWTRNKMQSYQYMIDYLKLAGTQQGQFYETL